MVTVMLVGVVVIGTVLVGMAAAGYVAVRLCRAAAAHPGAAVGAGKLLWRAMRK